MNKEEARKLIHRYRCCLLIDNYELPINKKQAYLLIRHTELTATLKDNHVTLHKEPK